MKVDRWKICHSSWPYSNRFANNVNDVRVYGGADCNSDHYLIVGKLNIKLKEWQQIDSSICVKYEITKIKNEDICRAFQADIGRLTLLTDINETWIEARWENIKNIITKTSEKVIGKLNRSKSKPWFKTVCEEALIRRNEARLKWLADTTNQLNEVRDITRKKENYNICRGNI